jgi:cytidylate kinase
MSCRVVAIARSLGAGGDEIGHAVAKELGFRRADEEIITRAAQEAGVSPETVAQVEHTPALITRILETMARAPTDPADPQGWLAAGTSIPERAFDYEDLIQRVITETANEGDVVIIAHGASIALAGMDGLLRVFVTGSREVRTERLARAAGVDEKVARKAISDSDRQRREYLRRFYGVRQEMPTHYDLVINTDALTVPRAVQLIVSAAGRQ